MIISPSDAGTRILRESWAIILAADALTPMSLRRQAIGIFTV